MNGDADVLEGVLEDFVKALMRFRALEVSISGQLEQ